MLNLIERFPVQDIKERTINLKKSEQLLAMQDIILQAPIPLLKRNVMCVGKNYKDPGAHTQKQLGLLRRKLKLSTF
jgi:hypothetical protein